MHATDAHGVVAKIYRPEYRTDVRREKLEAMIAAPPLDPTGSLGHHSLAWPREILLDDEGRCAGFTMPEVPRSSTRDLVTTIHPELRHPAFTWHHAVRVAANLAGTVEAVHAAGYVIGDLNARNVLVAGNALVTLVDCDSFQVRDPRNGRLYPCPVAEDDYTAPELFHRRLERARRSRHQDGFALAVLVFQLLMLARHPYSGTAALTRAEAIQGRRTFLLHRGLEPGIGTPPAAVLPPRLRRLFRRAFGAGARRPRARPSAAAWKLELDRAEGDLVPCERNANHVYGGHLRRCPWCAYAERWRFDPYPGVAPAVPSADAAPARRGRPGARARPGHVAARRPGPRGVPAAPRTGVARPPGTGRRQPPARSRRAAASWSELRRRLTGVRPAMLAAVLLVGGLAHAVRDSAAADLRGAAPAPTSWTATAATPPDSPVPCAGARRRATIAPCSTSPSSVRDSPPSRATTSTSTTPGAPRRSPASPT